MQYVTYLRVSTQRQGQSGLGIEAQRHAVAIHAKDGTIVREYLEIESGKKASRPQLAAALKHCRITGSTLLVAKLDRLARDVEFTANLLNSGVEFIAADNPHANRLSIHILAVMAEHEAKAISERTKAALAAAKARGVKIGGYRGGALSQAAHDLSATAVKAKADAFANNLSDILADIGPGTLGHTASELTRRMVKTPRGGCWTATAVRRLRARLA